MEEYIRFVEEQLVKWKEFSTLVRESDAVVSPAKINHALSSYQTINSILLSEHQRVKIEFSEFMIQFQQWWDKCYFESREKLNPISLAGNKWASKQEIESYARMSNKEEWEEFEKQRITLEGKVALMRRLVDAWKMHKDILIAISNNMRSEMRSLGIVDQANRGHRSPV